MLYPPIAPHRSGMLDAGDGHHLYWEASGYPSGWPVVVLHGGPGGSCTDRSRRWFHPDCFRIITFDQRGCGRSYPHASIEQNTTRHLIDDLERLRLMLDVERWVVMGQSWGTTLAIAYGEHYPDRVDAMILTGVFTARAFELDWLYPADVARSCHKTVTCARPSAQLRAAREWCAREDSVTSTALATPPAPLDARAALARARIGTHYFVNRYFLSDGELLANAHRLSGIPGVVVQGRADAVTPPAAACDLHLAWPGSRLELVDEAGHSTTDPELMRALMAATDSLLSPARARLARRGPLPSAPIPRRSAPA